MWINWAQQNPQAALEVVRSGKQPKRNETLARAIMRGDASLGPEMVEQLRNEAWAADALAGSFPLNGSLKDIDYFPASIRNPQVPDHGERYRVLSESITLGNFPPETTDRLRASLNRSFQSTVPAARDALGESGF